MLEKLVYFPIYGLKLVQIFTVCLAALLCTSVFEVHPSDAANANGLIEVQMKHLGLDSVRRSDLWVNMDDGSVIVLLQDFDKSLFPDQPMDRIRIKEIDNGVLLGVVEINRPIFLFFFDYYLMVNGNTRNMHTLVIPLALLALLLAVLHVVRMPSSLVIFSGSFRAIWAAFTALVLIFGSLLGLLVSAKFNHYSFFVVWMATFIFLSCSFFMAFQWNSFGWQRLRKAK